jgi:hypothetical protein
MHVDYNSDYIHSLHLHELLSINWGAKLTSLGCVMYCLMTAYKRRRSVKAGERRGDPEKAIKFVKVYWHGCSPKRSGGSNGILKATQFLARPQMGGLDFTGFDDSLVGISPVVSTFCKGFHGLSRDMTYCMVCHILRI